MVRVFVVYEAEPDAEWCEQHAELCRRVEGGTFRHGPVVGSPFGNPKFRYYAEWEFPDQESFKAALRSEEFAAAGRDAMATGLPFHVHFADVE